MQIRNDDDDGGGGDCIGSILGKLLRVLSGVGEIFIETFVRGCASGYWW